MFTLRLIDAHIHLSDSEYSNRIEELVTDANRAHVVAMISNSVDLQTSIRSLKLAERYSGLVFAAVGIHPWNVDMLEEITLEEISKLICEQNQKKAVIAIGEIGLDAKYEKTWQKQLITFKKMLQLAERLSLPIIVHSRGATAQIVDMLPSYKIKRVLLHWFSHPMTALSQAVLHDYYITEGPPVAYSNGIREVIAKVPLTNLLTETDGPVRYHKHPFNGQLTRPSFIPTVIEAIAEIKKVRVDDAADQVIRNFKEFFGIEFA